MKVSKLAVLLLCLYPLCFVFGDEYTTAEETETDSTTEKTLIDFFETRSARTITSRDIEQLPVTTIDEIIKLQPGVVETDSGIHIRGGRPDEIIYYVDGVEVKVPNFGWQSIHIDPSAIDEITLIRSGMNAEYGNVMSGVVDIRTKMMTNTRHSGSINFLTDEIFTTDKLNFGYNRYDIYFGGPIMNRFGYFVSGQLMLTDAYQKALYKVSSPRMDYTAHGKIYYRLPHVQGGIVLSGYRSREQYMMWKPPFSNTGTGLVSFLDKPMSRTKSWITSGTFNRMWTHTHISLQISSTHFDRVFGSRDYGWEEENNRAWYDDYRFKNEHLLVLLVDEKLRNRAGLVVRDLLVDSMTYYYRDYDVLRNDPFGIDRLTTTFLDYPDWIFWHNDDKQFQADLIQSIGLYHELKTGFDFTWYNVKYFKARLPESTLFPMDVKYSYYEREPFRFSGYIQDKIDVEGIIAQVGLRFDYFDANAFIIGNEWVMPRWSLIYSDPMATLSPRLAFSLPVRESMKFRFSYGHYYQVPKLDKFYNNADTARIEYYLFHSGSIFGNIFLEPERLVAYELALETVFFNDILLTITAFNKDYENIAELRRIQTIPYIYQYCNDALHKVAGIELILQKKLTNLWGFGIAYTLQYAKGKSPWAYQYYYESYIEPPKIEYWLDTDERHTIITNFDFKIPEDFFIFPLQNITSTLYSSFHSGKPYTPEVLAGDTESSRAGNVNSQRMPGYWNVDLKLSRCIQINRVRFIFTGLINNLFNTEQVVHVYGTTGKPDDHGDPEPPLGTFNYTSIARPNYSPQADYDHDGLITPAEYKEAYIMALKNYYTDATNYNNSFRIRVGIGFQF
ncbi:MAG: TonB-dependent receptor plug domain-containing protein [candidate division WOR-3 bacterium]|nr:MAG: TonB-dependent receptor plug domain-containing protein [candidate division WOR-3 bacterium]